MSRLLVSAKCCECRETFTPNEPLPKGAEADVFLGTIFDHGCPDGLWLFNEKDAP